MSELLKCGLPTVGGVYAPATSCSKNASMVIGDVPMCGHHAAIEALRLLIEEGRVSMLPTPTTRQGKAHWGARG